VVQKPEALAHALRKIVLPISSKVSVSIKAFMRYTILFLFSLSFTLNSYGFITGKNDSLSIEIFLAVIAIECNKENKKNCY
jgi:hypothetical protein